MNILTRLGALALWITVSSLTVAAGTWDQPVADFSKTIAEACGGAPVTLALANVSSLSSAQAGEIQFALERQLHAAKSSSTCNVRVTLSENLQELVWVAEVAVGGQSQVKITTVPRTNARPQTRLLDLALYKNLLLTQNAPILDALILDSTSPNARLFILDPENITVYRISERNWLKEKSWVVTHNHPFPRDVRGMLAPNQAHAVDAYLPGTICEVSQQASVCRDRDDPWKLLGHSAFFNSARNYFTGVLVPAVEKSAPFYSAAWLQNGTVYAGIDGRVRWSNEGKERVLPASSTSDWGSDLAIMKSDCGSGVQLLVTTAIDDNKADSLRAFDLTTGDPVQVSVALSFPGPLTSLWTHEDSGVVAVAHNLSTGQYEAYNISTGCNQ
jgi:hypothetical protein